MEPSSYASYLISLLEVNPSIKTATKIISPKKVVRVTRRTKLVKRATRVEYVVTIGVPNYIAVKFIKLCKEAKEPFPIKKIFFDGKRIQSTQKAVAKVGTTS